MESRAFFHPLSRKSKKVSILRLHGQVCVQIQLFAVVGHVGVPVEFPYKHSALLTQYPQALQAKEVRPTTRDSETAYSFEVQAAQLV